MFRALATIVIIFNLCQSLACAQPLRTVIIDTDVAFDDMLAITYLLQRPDIKIAAITISATGESHCLPAKANLQDLLTRLKQANIPIACGRNQPLRGHHRFPHAWSVFVDHLTGASHLTQQHVPGMTTKAITLLQQTLNQSQQAIDIIALGPLTNLGELLEHSPKYATNIHRIYIMGGAIHVPGNLQIGDNTLNTTAEWNIYIDPYAAQLVFASGIPITLIPLDVTNKVKFSPAFYQTIAQNLMQPAAAYIKQIHDIALLDQASGVSEADWFVWDSLAAVIASEPNIASTKREKLRVLTTMDYPSGTLVIDEKHGFAIDVCYNVQQAHFLSTISHYLTQPPSQHVSH